MSNIKFSITDNNFRSFFFQVIVLSIVIVFFYSISTNIIDNIESRGIKLGFDFLSNESGFSISETLIAYDESRSYFRVFLVGILNTIYVSFVAIIFSSLLGLTIGIARLSHNFLVRKLSKAYIELFRNIPLLLQILFWYSLLLNILPSIHQSISIFDTVFINLRGIYFPKIFISNEFIIIVLTIISSYIILFLLKKYYNFSNRKLANKIFKILYLLVFTVFILLTYSLVNIGVDYPYISGFNFTGGLSISPEFFALALALSIYTATYIAEAVRSGIESVDKGQKEASLSLGLSRKQVLKYIILPQALRVSIPPVINQYLNLIKNSSLAVAIGYPDLVNVFTGTTLNLVGQALEIIAMTMAVYLLISIFISIVLNIVNNKLKIKEQ